MDVFGILTIVSIVLGVVSATLAVAAFIFGWVSFRNTAHMQVEAQAILAKVSEKVEVIVDRTSHQMDKAWEYFTKPLLRHQSQLPELPSEVLSDSAFGKDKDMSVSYNEAAKTIWGLLFFIPSLDRAKVLKWTVDAGGRDKKLDSLLTLYMTSEALAKTLSPVEQSVYAASKELGEAIFRNPRPKIGDVG